MFRSTPTEKTSTSDILKNFKKNDLIFGLRTSYRTTLDGEILKFGHPYYYSNQLNCPVVDLVVENKEKPQNLTDAQRDYYDYLIEKRDYLIKAGGKPVPLMQNNPLSGSAYRRGCKLLIRSAYEEARVHFELSGIDMKRVCEKPADDLGVTNSELRSAYRDFIRTGTNPHLFFYLNGQSCSAPWEQQEHKKLWKAYKEKFLKKRKEVTEVTEEKETAEPHAKKAKIK